MKIRFAFPVSTTDGPFGHVGDVVIDPITRDITHVVVEPHHRHVQARLVPVDDVTADDHAVVIGLSEEQVLALPRVADSDFVGFGEQVDLGDDWDVGIEHVVAMPCVAGGMGMGGWVVSATAPAAVPREPDRRRHVHVMRSVRFETHSDAVDEPLTLAKSPVNVLVVCADPAIRSELVQLVEAVTGEVVDPSAGSGLAAALLSAIARPEIVVLDVVDVGGEHDVLGISSASPGTAIVVFTARADTRSVMRMLSAGARTVVAKGDGAALRTVLGQLAMARAA